jgi:hypothetical protein
MKSSAPNWITLNWTIQMYLNYNAWFMNNILLKQGKTKLLNVHHSVDNTTAIIQQVVKMQYISLLLKYTKAGAWC